MSKPLISVITVCYNAEKTIRETVQSVLDQDHSAIEYVIVDGASTDATLSILKSFSDSRILLVSEPDQGLYDAINKGIQMSAGDVICLLHADDVFASKQVLAEVASCFIQNPGLEALSTAVHIFKPGKMDKPYRIYKSSGFKLWQFRLGIQPPHPGFFVSRSGFEKVGYYRTQYKISGDFDWLLRALLLVRLNVRYSDLVTVYMRDGGMSSSGWKSKVLLNNEILRILKLHGIYSNKLLVYSKYLLKVFQLRKI